MSKASATNTSSTASAEMNSATKKAVTNAANALKKQTASVSRDHRFRIDYPGLLEAVNVAQG